MATTPPPSTSRHDRARTPPSPKHGARFDRYQPYSPRRSNRGTANPYSTSSMGGAGHNQTSVRSSARAPTYLSSPPSSPAASPTKPHSSPDNTKLRRSADNKKAYTHSGEIFDSDSDEEDNDIASRLAQTNTSANMLPTPSKTPLKKRAQAGRIPSTGRVLNFQPDRPNDVMPTQREVKKQKARQRSSLSAFDIYVETAEPKPRNGPSVEVYQDWDARVPELHPSEDNPFLGPRAATAAPQRRSKRNSKKTEDEVADEQRMKDAVDRGEGMIFNFRGKRVFRPFEVPVPAHDSDAAVFSGLGDFPGIGQRTLRHQVGSSVERPLTRSAIKPRLLFPTATPDVDEEALTDIEMHDAVQEAIRPTTSADTPAKSASSAGKPPTPPTTARTTRKKNPTLALPMPSIFEDDAEHDSNEWASSPEVRGRRSTRKIPSPFDAWQRTKSSKKREGESTVEGATGGKRTKSAASASASAGASSSAPNA